MAFKKVSGQIKYPLAKGHTVKKGDKIVDEGVFVGAKASPMYPTSPTFHFEQRADSVTVGLNGGHLSYMHDNGKLKLGKCYNVYYDGYVVLEKGAMKGKSAHTFSLEEDDVDAVAVAGLEPTVNKAAQAASLASGGDDITL